MKVLHLKMGGTIDSKAYPPKYQPDAEPDGNHLAYEALKEIFEQHAPETELVYKEICDLDSKGVGWRQKKDLLTAILDAEATEEYDRIIITGGTDRAPQLGRFLERHGVGKKLSVIFTGAIWPLSNGEVTNGKDKPDARNNLKRAALEEFPHGANIVIGDFKGRARNVRKDFNARRFVKRNVVCSTAQPIVNPFIKIYEDRQLQVA